MSNPVLRISEKSKKRIREKIVKKKHVSKQSDYAAGGRCLLFLGVLLRGKLDVVAESTGQTYSHIMRLGLDYVLDVFMSTGQLPEFRDSALKAIRQGAKRTKSIDSTGRVGKG